MRGAGGRAIPPRRYLRPLFVPRSHYTHTLLTLRFQDKWSGEAFHLSGEDRSVALRSRLRAAWRGEDTERHEDPFFEVCHQPGGLRALQELDPEEDPGKGPLAQELPRRLQPTFLLGRALLATPRTVAGLTSFLKSYPDSVVSAQVRERLLPEPTQDTGVTRPRIDIHYTISGALQFDFDVALRMPGEPPVRLRIPVKPRSGPGDASAMTQRAFEELSQKPGAIFFLNTSPGRGCPERGFRTPSLGSGSSRRRTKT
jgi:hypothetical protein